MRVALKTLLEKLGVGHLLSAYESQPWFLYDADRGITCSAEVRMGPGSEDLEAEIQFMYDEGKIPVPAEGDTTAQKVHGPDIPVQIMRMRAVPTDNDWTPKELFVKGVDYNNKIYNWEEKGCNFFRACIGAIQMNLIPDVDDLITKELADDEDISGSSGRIGRKAPKIKPAQLLGMKK